MSHESRRLCVPLDDDVDRIRGDRWPREFRIAPLIGYLRISAAVDRYYGHVHIYARRASQVLLRILRVNVCEISSRHITAHARQSVMCLAKVKPFEPFLSRASFCLSFKQVNHQVSLRICFRHCIRLSSIKKRSILLLWSQFIVGVNMMCHNNMYLSFLSL